MGCRGSRSIFDSTCTENKELAGFEKNLNFLLWTPRQVEAVLRRLIQPSLQPSEAIKRFNHSQNVKLSGELEQFLLQKVEREGEKAVLMFGVLGIMLSFGTREEICESIWYLFDTEIKDTLDKAYFTKMIDYMITASVDFTIEMEAIVDKKNEVKINEYKERCKERIQPLSEKLTNFFLEKQESISKAQFFSKLKEQPNGHIHTPFHIRCHLEHVRVIPKKYANQFANMKRVSLTSKKLA
jgi:hypothetical protein